MSEQRTRVVHVNDRIPDAVYIGRAVPRRGLKASPFANPYKIGGPSDIDEIMSRSEAVGRYAGDLLRKNRQLLRVLPVLRGKPLSCWCRRDGETASFDNECHGDSLVYLLAMYSDDELREMSKDGGQ